MFVCLHCGHSFEEAHNRYNRRWSDSDDSEQYCPNCGSEDIEEAEQCSICGEWHSEDALSGGVCEKCLDKHATIENAIKWGEDEREEAEKFMKYHSIRPSQADCLIPINGFLAYVYTPSEIDEILRKDFESLRKDFPAKAQEYASNYITDDPSAFAEWYKEAMKNDAE